MSKLRLYIVAAIAALSAVACTMELVVEEPQVNLSIPTYTAYVDVNDTKSVLDENVSKWSGEEYIQIVGKKGSYNFATNVSGTATSAEFVYKGTSTFDEKEVLAVYPCGSAVYSGNFDDLYVSNVTVPVNQKPVAGSYDPLAAVAVAHSVNDKLQFKNAVSLLKFTMGSDGIRNVTVWGEMNEENDPSNIPAYYVEGNVYLSVGEWVNDSPKFAAYFWGGGNQWVAMTAVSGQTNLYTCAIPKGSTGMVFCRMNPAHTDFRWNTDEEKKNQDQNRPVWNQTVDLSLEDGNLFTITNPWDGPDGMAECAGETISSKKKLGFSGTGTVYYNDGEPTVKGFSQGYVSMTGDFVKGETYYIAVAPGTLKNFTMEFSRTGDSNKYPVKSTSKPVTFKRNTIHDLGTIVTTGFTTDPAVPNADKPCTIYYVPDKNSPFLNYTGDLYAHVWVRSGGVDSHGPTWGDNSAKYKFTKVEDNKWSLTLSSSIRSWFNSGTTPIEQIGVLVRSADKTKQTADELIDVVDSKYTITMPEGVKHGINYNNDGSVTLVLYDRDNQGNHHDFCNLLWDDNWWGDSGKPKKPLYYDNNSGCWWITLTNLDPDTAYKFQYQLGYGSNVTVTTFDPYSEVVYDTYNDQWISDNTYPGLFKDYGSIHGGRASGFISEFKINREVYNWKVTDFKIPDANDMIIYELLVRDFTDNLYGEGSIKAAMGQLDYLKNLGVTAVELMPIQEFDGNDGWGYGNHAYFALDKAYGTRTDYKKFIDACHEKGIAVIVDVVYNHATGMHPYAAMYWDYDKTASNNPWFNVSAPHGWSVYHDWNHSNPMVRDHVKRSLEYLLTEYKVDGFRFDLTKGFTQSGDTDSRYDDSRVGYLKEYNYHIKCVNPNAVMICEHFVDDENYALGQDGIKVWRNMNHPYTKSMKRDMSQSDFTGVTNGFNSNGMMADWNHFGSLVGYMESHDEQRTNYEGQWSYDGSSIPFDIRMERAKANAAFFLLVPGPKMIWQFGEIGYDISIDDNGRTGKKPCKTTEYMNVANRKALYDTYSKLIAFRKKNHTLFDYDVNFRWYVDSGHQTGRYLFATKDGKTMAVFANFGQGSKSIGVELPAGGNWYQYDDASKVWTGSKHTVQMAEGQFYVLVSDKSMCL